jgi:hypothetical protein
MVVATAGVLKVPVERMKVRGLGRLGGARKAEAREAV